MNQFESSRVAVAAVLIGAGVILLGLRFFGGIAGTLWPWFIILPGVVLLALALSGVWQAKVVAVFGGVVTATGLILIVQDATDYYQSWAYAWTLLPAAAGAALFFVGQREGDQSAQANGRRLMLLGGIAFIVFAVAFEALIFHERLVEGSIVLPILLIVGGAVLLMHMPGRNGGDRTPPSSKPE